MPVLAGHSRQEEEARWRARTRDALAEYRAAVINFNAVYESSAQGLVPSPDGLYSLAQAQKAETRALRNYRDTLRIYSELCLHGVLPPDGQRNPLTEREGQILSLIAEGKSSRQIADELGLAVKTVQCHRCHVMSKLGVHKAAELTRVAIRMGLVEPW